MTTNLRLLRSISSKLKKVLDQRPLDSLQVRVTLQRKWKGEKSIRVWGNVFTQTIIGDSPEGLVVLVPRKEVEKQLSKISDMLVDAVRKK